ncbi:MAG: dihydroneopterin aldolase [Rhodospirillaceae bacterium]|nr:dihydroneopterin aldolase [Rhodospirillaceae bacterium]
MSKTVVEPLKIADATAELRHVFVRDLVLDCNIGVHLHERGRVQRVRINLDLGVSERGSAHNDRLENVVCYEDIVKRVRAITADGHVNLAETLAERIATICLQDPLCRSARVRVEKLAVFEDAGSVGVEIERISTVRSWPRT